MDRSAFRYTENYCEENVFHMAGDPRFGSAFKFVVFISNQDRRIAMTNQRSRPDGVVIWDYHVILLARFSLWEVWDLDTALAFPSPASDYLTASFPPDVPDAFAPLFRLVPADTFVAEFASDRRHMKSVSGGFVSAPPQWAAIRPELGSNLDHFIDPGDARFGPMIRIGKLFNLTSA